MVDTPKQHHAPIRMRCVPSSAGLVRRGDFCWQAGPEGHRTLVLMVPCIDGSTMYTRWRIGRHGSGPYKRTGWTWDGNTTEPTLTPSLHALGVWHGWVKKGLLVEA